jgi:GTPase SAR1 family protein
MPRPKRNFDFNFKIAFVGNAGVGKTALMVRFTKGTFQERLCTVGICSDTKILSIDDDCRVQVCNKHFVIL